MLGRRLFDCQLAIAPWGTKAKFRRAKVGLMRKGSTVFIITIGANGDYNKLQISNNSVEILPAAIRFHNLAKDLFIRQARDEQRYSTMIRGIKVLIREDRLRQNGKAEQIDQFISNIPVFGELNKSDLLGPPPLRTWITSDVTNQATMDNAGITLICRNNTSTSSRTDNNNLGSHGSVQLNDSLTSHRIIFNNNHESGQYPTLENKQLKCIKISGLERLPKSLWFRANLNELIITDCNLTIVPKQLEKFATSLVYLDLSNNRIEKLPRTFCCKMNKLTSLNLSNNQIETLPIEIKFLRRLVTLDLSNNRLRMLPSTFSDLNGLRTLNVSNNNLSQLPAFRTDEIRLQELDVSYNPLDGASNTSNTFEVYPSIDDGDSLDYLENPFCNKINSSLTKTKFPKLFELSLLNIVRYDKLFKLASEESLPKTIVSTMQRDIFKCYRCSKMSILPAYNSTDILDYVSQVGTLKTTGNYRNGMTFMKLLCRSCFDSMSS